MKNSTSYIRNAVCARLSYIVHRDRTILELFRLLLGKEVSVSCVKLEPVLKKIMNTGNHETCPEKFVLSSGVLCRTLLQEEETDNCNTSTGGVTKVVL